MRGKKTQLSVAALLERGATPREKTVAMFMFEIGTKAPYSGNSCLRSLFDTNGKDRIFRLIKGFAVLFGIRITIQQEEWPCFLTPSFCAATKSSCV